MTEEQLNQVKELTHASMDKAFVMGMNYQRLTTLDHVSGFATMLDYSAEEIGIISEMLGLLKEATDADIPTRTDN
jgi:hypothetical protein